MAGSGEPTEKRESRERPLRQFLNLLVVARPVSSISGGSASIFFLRSWPSLFQAFRTDPGTGYSLALNQGRGSAPLP